MRLITVILVVLSFVLAASAQEEPVAKKWNFEIKIGFNTFGPARRWDKLIV